MQIDCLPACSSSGSRGVTEFAMQQFSWSTMQGPVGEAGGRKRPSGHHCRAARGQENDRATVFSCKVWGHTVFHTIVNNERNLLKTSCGCTMFHVKRKSKGRTGAVRIDAEVESTRVGNQASGTSERRNGFSNPTGESGRSGDHGKSEACTARPREVDASSERRALHATVDRINRQWIKMQRRIMLTSMVARRISC